MVQSQGDIYLIQSEYIDEYLFNVHGRPIAIYGDMELERERERERKRGVNMHHLSYKP